MRHSERSVPDHSAATAKSVWKVARWCAGKSFFFFSRVVRFRELCQQQQQRGKKGSLCLQIDKCSAAALIG